MKIKLFLLLILLTACANKKTENSEESKKIETETYYGLKKINQDNLSSLSEILMRLEKKENLTELNLEEGIKVKGLECKISGTIVDMCQMSGCWFTFKTEEGKELFVQMKEHKPTSKDWSGKTIVVEGIAYTEELSIAELRLKAKEEGASRDELSKITKPQTKYNFLAEGAVLKK